MGNKWVFRIKRHLDGYVSHYKASLVAKGYNHQSDIDYSETFSIVIKATTIWTIIAIVVMKQWSLHQLDVLNAFLYGFLIDEVHME